jgi:hypothetical protein
MEVSYSLSQVSILQDLREPTMHVHDILTILLALIGILALIGFITLVCVFMLFMLSKSSPSRSRRRTSPDEILASLQINQETSTPEIRAELVADLKAGSIDAREVLEVQEERINAVAEALAGIFEYLVDEFDEHHLLISISILHIYFTALPLHIAQVKKLHRACNAAITDLAFVVTTILPDADVRALENMAQTKTFLPGGREWRHLLSELNLPSVPYMLLRLLCLHRAWKEVGTILYKVYCCKILLRGYIGAV